MTEFHATFTTTRPMSVKFQTTSETMSVEFGTVITRVPHNYGLITRIGNKIRVS